MQGVAIKDIPNALVEKKEMVGNVNELAFESAWNACRKEMSQVKIGLKREETINILMQTYPMNDRPTIERYFNALEANLPDLLTVVKEGM